MPVSDSPATTAGQVNGQRSVKRRTVNITGRGTDVAFIIDEHAPIEVVARDLGAQLSGRGALFSEGGVSVNTGGRNFSSWEKAAIRRIFEDNSGLRVSRFVSSAGDNVSELYVPDLEDGEDPVPSTIPRKPVVANSPSPVSWVRPSVANYNPANQRTRNHAMVITSTFRSGETVRHYGDVIVLGDVNPGSEIAADGDIVVMGTMKGFVHAGATGDNRAAIIALEIASPRLRIGDCEAVVQGRGVNPGDRGRGKGGGSGELSIAYARRGAIYISPYAGRFARYTKGVAYDG